MEEVYANMPWVKDLVTKADPIWDALRWLGYGLLRILAQLVDVLYSAIQGLLGINIMSIEPVQKFVDSVSPLGWSVLVIALIGAAILLMLYPRRNKGDMVRGLFMAVVLMISVPFMFQTLNAFKEAGVSDMSNAISETNNPGQAILIANTYDVVNSTSGETIILGTNDPYYLDINVRISKDNTLFSKKITSVNNGVMYGEDLGNGFFGWGEERLYAYNFNLIEPLFTLLIMLICLLFAGFKLARLLFDLVTHQVVAPIVFASDIAGGGRTKKFMQSLVSNYILMVLILVLLKVYIDLTTWATSSVTDIWVRILLMAGASWGVIDGPDIILKLIGVDAGVRSATAVMMGANAAVNMGRAAGGAVAGVVSMAGSTIANAPGNIVNMAGTASGAISGLKGMAGNAEMGSSLATNGQARSDAGISGFMDMRNSMRSGSDVGTSGTDSQSQPSGYSNVPKVSGSTLGDRFSSAQDKVSSGISRTAATVGYAAGKTVDTVSSVAKAFTGNITPTVNTTTPPSPVPYPANIPHEPPSAGSSGEASPSPVTEQSNYNPPKPTNKDKT